MTPPAMGPANESRVVPVAVAFEAPGGVDVVVLVGISTVELKNQTELSGPASTVSGQKITCPVSRCQGLDAAAAIL